jgi:hypothetical protein
MSLKRLHGLRKSDIVTIHLILSERTRGLVGAAKVALMKPTARLLRGPVEAMNLSRGRRFRPALRIAKECGGHSCAYSACHPKRCDDRFGGTRNWLATSLRARCPRSVMPIW